MENKIDSEQFYNVGMTSINTPTDSANNSSYYNIK